MILVVLDPGWNHLRIRSISTWKSQVLHFLVLLSTSLHIACPKFLAGARKKRVWSCWAHDSDGTDSLWQSKITRGLFFFMFFPCFFFQFTAIFQTWCCYCSIFFHARYISMKFKQHRGCNVIPCNSGSWPMKKWPVEWHFGYRLDVSSLRVDHNRCVNWIRNAHSWWTCTTAALLYLESSWPSWWWLLGWQTLGDEVLPLAILSQQMLIDALHRARLGWLYHMQHGITAFCGSKFVL